MRTAKEKLAMKGSISLKDQWRELRLAKEALLAANYYNFETLKGVIKAAHVVKDRLFFNSPGALLSIWDYRLPSPLLNPLLNTIT